MIFTPFKVADENASIASSSDIEEPAFLSSCVDTPTYEYARIKLLKDSPASADSATYSCACA